MGWGREASAGGMRRGFLGIGDCGCIGEGGPDGLGGWCVVWMVRYDDLEVIGSDDGCCGALFVDDFLLVLLGNVDDGDIYLDIFIVWILYCQGH